MIKVIEAADLGNCRETAQQMFRIRAQVFWERLGWDVTVKDGLETDRFDDADPLYLVSVNEWTGRVEGSLRLLPTTGPNMLREVFPILIPGETVASTTIWESSRVSIDPNLPQETTNRRLNRVTTDLLCGIVEVGLRAGLTFVVSVFDAKMVRIFRAAGVPADIIGRPTRVGDAMCYAGLFEISQDARQRIGNVRGRHESVLASDVPVVLRAA